MCGELSGWLHVGLTAIVCPTQYKRFCHRRLRCSSKGKGRCHIYLVPCLPRAMFTSPESKRKFQNQLACEGDPSPAKTSDTPRRKRFKVWHGFRRAQQQSLEHENHDVTDDWSPIQDPSSSPEIGLLFRGHTGSLVPGSLERARCHLASHGFICFRVTCFRVPLNVHATIWPHTGSLVSGFP